MLKYDDYARFVVSDDYNTLTGILRELNPGFDFDKRVFIVGLGNKDKNKKYVKSFPKNSVITAIDLNPGDFKLNNLLYLKEDVFNVFFDKVAKNYGTLVFQRVCGENSCGGLAQLIDGFVDKFGGFNNIIIRFCENPNHYLLNDKFSKNEFIWFHALSIEEQLISMGFNTMLTYTFYKDKKDFKIPYALVASKQEFDDVITRTVPNGEQSYLNFLYNSNPNLYSFMVTQLKGGFISKRVNLRSNRLELLERFKKRIK